MRTTYRPIFRSGAKRCSAGPRVVCFSRTPNEPFGTAGPAAEKAIYSEANPPQIEFLERRSDDDECLFEDVAWSVSHRCFRRAHARRGRVRTAPVAAARLPASAGCRMW